MKIATIRITNPAGRSETIDLQDNLAWALAELCKRITFSDCHANAVDEEEAHRMIEATGKLGTVLSRVGYNPR